jgi:hypothetical protein
MPFGFQLFMIKLYNIKKAMKRLITQTFLIIFIAKHIKELCAKISIKLIIIILEFKECGIS